MSIWMRASIALVVVVLDLVAFAVPICALAAAYVLLARPRWFLTWVVRVYEEPSSPEHPGAMRPST